MPTQLLPITIAVRRFFSAQFDEPLQIINRHCAELHSNFEGPSLNDTVADLQRVQKACVLLEESLDSVKLHGLLMPDTENINSISVLRHNLRTPLNAISGYTELISEKLEPTTHTRHRHHCIGILNAARELLTATDGLCEYLKNEKQLLFNKTNPKRDISSQLQRITKMSNAQHQTGQLLVVDDIEDNRVLLKRYLTPEGHAVSLAESGAIALEMIQTQSFDVILLDIMMPAMNGLQVLETLKRSDQYKQIPIIVISGMADVDAVAPCIAAGAEDYLTKPFDPVLLRARINSSLLKKKWGDREREYLKQIERQKRRSDAILQAILPTPIIQRLKNSDEPIADRLDHVTVMFADIVGFTAAVEHMLPEALLDRLDNLFSGLDKLTQHHGVEKIKTIGDGYMAASGVPHATADHVDRVLNLAIDIQSKIKNIDNAEDPFALRIGIHTGPVVAGLVGRHRYTYDLWGETVNLASRIESAGTVSKISVSAAVVEQANARFQFEKRTTINLKGIGLTPIYTLESET